MEECSPGEAGVREKEAGPGKKETKYKVMRYGAGTAVASSAYSILSVERPCELLPLGEESRV